MMGKRISITLLRWLGVAALLGGLTGCGPEAPGPANGWLGWRGPQQNGTSTESGLPERWQPGGENHLWDTKLSGRGCPVVANGRLYCIGYRGEGTELREVLSAFDARSGKLIWEQAFRDFLSDIIYNRYAIGSPVVDRDTGNVYAMTSAGVLAGFHANGELLWKRSLMESLGRLTFPNGRTGSPVIDKDLVIVHGITANWGSQGPGRDRFYAFDKTSGELVWSSTPGTRPKDSSFSTPVLAWRDNQRVLYAGTGCGHVVAINARTGAPLWRYRISRGGVNASPVFAGPNRLIAIHGKENLDASTTGRMVAVNLEGLPGIPPPAPRTLDVSREHWRADLSMFTSSPVIVGDRIYQVVHDGVLCAVDAENGAILWRHKLATSQLHASPAWGDGKLYIPTKDGVFHILRPTDTGVEVLSKTQLEGNCLGAPAICDGRVFVLTTERLYAFGARGGNPEGVPPWPRRGLPKNLGKPAQLQAVPSELILQPGDVQRFRVRALDANGNAHAQVQDVKWEPFIPPAAKVRSTLDARFSPGGELVVPSGAQPSAGMMKAVSGNLSGTIRGRIAPPIPFTEDFEGFELTEIHPTENVPFAHPPLPWIGGRFKWEVREQEGGKVLAKTLDRELFQRTITFIGHPEMRGYVLEADVMAAGTRRMVSTVGLINQRYIISLVGNWQQLEVNSNHDRLKESVSFPWEPNVWYRLRTWVDLSPDGSAIVRAKAWPRGEPEPGGWTLEVRHKNGHRRGAPGLYGFSPQSLKRVFIDNITLKHNP